MPDYSWVPAFKALGDWLAGYENRKEELLKIIQDLDIGGSILVEMCVEDGRNLTSFIDPFTFIDTLMSYKVDIRLKKISALIDDLGLQIDVPKGFYGLPDDYSLGLKMPRRILLADSSYRSEIVVSDLWVLFNQVRSGDVKSELFNRVLKIADINFRSLTECLFYIRPDLYFPVNVVTEHWLQICGRKLPQENWEDYHDLLNWLHSCNNQSFYEIYHQACVSFVDKMEKYFFSSKSADDYLNKRYPNTRTGTSHLSAFKTAEGRQLAFDPGRNPESKTVVKIFVDSLPPEGLFHDVQEYSAGDTRNHHLRTHAPALSQGHQAWLVALTNFDQLEVLCDWYEGNSVKEIKMTDSATPKTTKRAALNQILYGPPGTGKTYATTEKAVALADPQWLQELESQGLSVAEQRKAVKQRYDELVAAKRIAFTTFHQSFSYEDFIEGIRAETKGDQVSYSVEDGVFKALATLAAEATSPSGVTSTLSLDGRRIWKMSLGNTLKGEYEAYEDCIENNYIGLGWGDDIDFSQCQDRASVQDIFSASTGEQYDSTSYNVSAVNTFKNVMRKGDIVIVSDGNHKFRAIAEVNGDYYYAPESEGRYFNQCRSVRWLRVFETSMPKEALFHKSLSQMTLYELKPSTLKIEKLKDFLTAPAEKIPGSDNYVLIIDEINRGNISRIFGELITLLEPDKRKGGADERSVILPYSKETFTVPDNLYVLGTMNTADKSLAQLDLALRRRFEFVELMPDPTLLEGLMVHGVDASELLKVMNQRIEVLLDRDHTLGHAYFWPLLSVATEEERQNLLADIFAKRIIPLLQEYFFADWERIGWVLNDPAKSVNHRFIDLENVGTSVAELFSADIASLITDRRYRINKNAFMEPEAYRGILPGAGVSA